MLGKLSSILALVVLLGLAAKVYAQSPALVEFFYLDPDRICVTCDSTALPRFIAASNLVDRIQSDYGDKVQVDRVSVVTAEGRERFSQYGLTNPPVIVVNHKIQIQGDELTEENVRRYIDAYLRGDDPASNTFQPVTAFFAFSTGFVSGLSPCLMATLGFILSYTSGTVSSFRSGMFRVLAFGIGFVSALLLIGALLTAVLTWAPSFTTTMTWTAVVLMIAVGLNLVGLLSLPSSLRFLGQKLGSRGRVEIAQRYRATTVGLFSLGFLFYFVSICTAPLSFTVLPTLSAPSNVYLLPLFAIGALLPFLLVGVVAGGSPALAKRIGQQHRLKIRALSGAILLVYSVWLVGFNLLSSQMANAFPHAASFSLSLLAVFIFILAYSASTSTSLRAGLGIALALASGLIVGMVMTEMSFALVETSFISFLFVHAREISIGIAITMIFGGLVLTGRPKSLTTNSLIQKSADKKSVSILGLCLLGFLTFFVTIRAFPLTEFIIDEASIDTYLLLAFSLALLIPFLAIGVISGVIPKLAGEMCKKRQLQIRAFSGMILIAYGLWLLLNQFV